MPIVAAKIDKEKPRGSIVLQKEVKVREPVRVLVVRLQPALYAHRKAIRIYCCVESST